MKLSNISFKTSILMKGHKIDTEKLVSTMFSEPIANQAWI